MASLLEFREGTLCGARILFRETGRVLVWFCFSPISRRNEMEEKMYSASNATCAEVFVGVIA